MTPELSIKISADIDLLRDNFRKAIAEIKGLDKDTRAALMSVDKSFATLANDIDKSMGAAAATTSKASSSITKDLAKVAAASAQTGTSVKKGSNEAAFALTNLGRVAQDAPFGFIGIQNNLNPLLESFQRLRAETGSNSLAIKALGQSLTGPAGLGIALSFVSSAILIYQQYQQKANKATNDSKKSADDYLLSLDQVTQSLLKGAQNSTKEIAQLYVLYSAYQNTNLSIKARKEAYRELQDQYPAYFGNIKFEQQASEKTKKAYDELTASIIATGRARAAVDLIAKNETRRLENEQKIVDLQKEQLKNQALADRAAAKQLQRPGSEAEFSQRQANTQRFAEAAFEAQVKINNLKTDNNLLDGKNLKLVEAVNVQLEKGAKILGSVGALRKEAEGITNSNILGPLKGGIQLGDLSGRDAQVRFRALEIPKGPKGLTEYIRLVQEASASNDRFVESINNLAASTISSGLSDAFSSIGQSLAEGTNAIEGFGNALLSAFAGFLSQLGQMFIKEGIAQIGYGIAKNLILPGSGVNNIAGGAGMIAAGAAISIGSGALKGAGSKGSKYVPVNQIPSYGSPKGYASGGFNLPAQTALVGERGPELVNLPTGASVMNNQSTNRILKGQNQTNIVLEGNFGIGLEQLYWGLKKVGKKLDNQGVFA